MTAVAPVIETARLRLRGFIARDLDRQAAALADPKVYEHLSGVPTTREDTWRKMLAGPGLWAVLGYGYWAVERKADRLFVGQVGFADFKRELTPSIEGEPEMGWIFTSDAHGLGFAGEAVAAALAWADQALPGRSIPAIIDAANAASIRLAERAGFSAREDAVYRGEPILLFRRPSPA